MAMVRSQVAGEFVNRWATFRAKSLCAAGRGRKNAWQTLSEPRATIKGLWVLWWPGCSLFAISPMPKATKEARKSGSSPMSKHNFSKREVSFRIHTLNSFKRWLYVDKDNFTSKQARWGETDQVKAKACLSASLYGSDHIAHGTAVPNLLQIMEQTPTMGIGRGVCFCLCVCLIICSKFSFCWWQLQIQLTHIWKL